MPRSHLTPRMATAAALGALLLAACVGGADTPSVGPPLVDEPAPVDEAGDQPWLTDGEHLGHLRFLDVRAGIIRLDLVEWINVDEEPNGFRVENPDPALWEGQLAPEISASVIDCTQECVSRDVALADLASGVVRPLNGEHALFDVLVEGTRVRSIAERYTP